MKAQSSKFFRIIAFLLCFLLCIEQSSLAQIAGQLDISGHLTALHNSLISDTFRPLHLRYLQYNNLNNSFQLFLDKGSLKNPNPQELQYTTKTLLNYFFVGITLPNDTFWVNLRPDAEDQIIDDRLAQTDVGKIMLESDLLLKKDTARFTSPETPEGKEYWDKLYQKAGELFGAENITIPTLTRPWIVPDEIIIRETTDSAYIYKATLKVMLEQDYLKDSAIYNFKDDRLKELNEYSSQLIRELIIPKLTKEVNSSKRYASLRQVYYSLIMAQWFKARFKGLSDKQDLTNLTSKENWSKTTYFQAYQKSFKDGEYNIQEPIYTPYGQTIRSYFSGGEILNIGRMPAFGEVVYDPKTGGLKSSIPTGSSPIFDDKVGIGLNVKGTNNLGELGEMKIGRVSSPMNTDKESKSVVIQILENTRATILRIASDVEKILTRHSSLINFFGISYQDVPVSNFGKTEKAILIDDSWYRAVVVYEGILDNPETVKIRRVYVSARDNSSRPYVKLELIKQEALRGELKEAIHEALNRFPEADAFFKQSFLKGADLRYSNPYSIFYPWGFNEEERKCLDDWQMNNPVINHLFKDVLLVKAIHLMTDDVIALVFSERETVGAYGGDAFIFHRGRIRLPNLGDRRNIEAELESYRNEAGTLAHEIMHRFYSVGGAELYAQLYQHLINTYPNAFAMIRRQDSDDGILAYFLGAITSYSPYVFPGSTSDQVPIRAETVEYNIEAGLLPKFMSPRNLKFEDVYLDNRYYELVQDAFEQQKKSASSSIQQTSITSSAEMQDRSSSPARISGIDDGVVNKMIKAMYGLNAKIKGLLSNILNYTSKEDIARMFIRRRYIREIGSGKRQFIVSAGVLKSINYDLPEDSPYRYISVGAHKDRYVLVEIDELGKVEKVFIFVEWSGMDDGRDKIFVELSDSLGETEEDKVKIKSMREKIEELLRSIDLKTYKVSEQLEWRAYVPFGRRPGDIERQIEDSILLKWLLSLPEGDGATISSQVKILAPVRERYSGIYLRDSGFISANSDSFPHEFAHHIFRNLSPEAKKAWIDYLKEHEPDFVDRIMNFTHRDLSGYKRDRMTPDELENKAADEWFAFSIEALNDADSEKSMLVEKLVDLGILPQWMRPSIFGVKGDRLNEDYYLGLARDLAEQNYVKESLGIVKRVLQWGYIRKPEVIAKTKGIIDGFRKFYGDDTTNYLLSKLDNIKASSPVSVQSKDFKFGGIDDSASSSSIPKETRPGGIDFRSLPIVTQAVSNLSANISSSSIHNLISVNLDEEWLQIERMANSGIIPSSERIKEYIQTSCAQDSITQDRDKILLCISDILRLEEERCDHTNSTLRDILVVLESINSAQEFKEVFLGKAI